MTWLALFDRLWHEELAARRQLEERVEGYEHATRRLEATVGALEGALREVGSGRCCSPRHRMTLYSVSACPGRVRYRAVIDREDGPLPKCTRCTFSLVRLGLSSVEKRRFDTKPDTEVISKDESSQCVE